MPRQIKIIDKSYMDNAIWESMKLVKTWPKEGLTGDIKEKLNNIYMAAEVCRAYNTIECAFSRYRIDLDKIDFEFYMDTINIRIKYDKGWVMKLSNETIRITEIKSCMDLMVALDRMMQNCSHT